MVIDHPIRIGLSTIIKNKEDTKMGQLTNPLIKAQSEDEGFKIDFSSYTSDTAKPSQSLTEPAPKKRGRPPKTKTLSDGNVIITGNTEQTDLTMTQSNVPYIQSYAEPNMLLRGSIGDIDKLNGIVTDQLDAVVESKTLRKKYDYVSELSGTAANLISTKVRTISEMNKIITDSHNLDIRRMKELNMAKAGEAVSDDKRMMDMYSAFINTPLGSYGAVGPQFPSIQDMTMPGDIMRAIDITGGSPSMQTQIDPGYEQWKQTMSPETAKMIMQKTNPNIQTVVVYDQTTNNKYFDAVDRSTGQSIPGYPLPDPYLLADTYPNVNNGTARNSNIDAVYPLVLTGAPSSLQDY